MLRNPAFWGALVWFQACNDGAKGQDADLQTQIDDLSDQLDTIQTLLDDLAGDGDFTDSLESIAAIQTTVDTLATTVSGLDTDLATAESDIAQLQSDLDAATFAQGQVPNLQDYLTVDTVNDLVVFSGANVQILSGSGETDDDVFEFSGATVTAYDETMLTGLGNLVIGYQDVLTDLTGSHNLVVGDEHTVAGFGGIVAGMGHTMNAAYGVAAGGDTHNVVGHWGACFGGTTNETNVVNGTAVGGSANTAGGAPTLNDPWVTVVGGNGNSATAPASLALGGQGNVVTGAFTGIVEISSTSNQDDTYFTNLATFDGTCDCTN